jgi:hypothetical protein
MLIRDAFPSVNIIMSFIASYNRISACIIPTCSAIQVYVIGLSMSLLLIREGGLLAR